MKKIELPRKRKDYIAKPFYNLSPEKRKEKMGEYLFQLNECTSSIQTRREVLKRLRGDKI